ncbi:MFS transporter [Candidatus Pelagibacter sp. RS40]|uniref:MFS transporter n=1 Tax=Candidatus Pelagibacter sp. RS40 TaxID=1977865 RepID=UPI000A1576C3|nr:MFS transporter [Candidatus Pelagibacter sp. RS40]ARJ48609.1 MFS transporter [Candidatus Pelagibacter sp. RS40]
MNRNLFILILSQVFGFTAATVTVFISGIIGSDLSSIKTLSTLPPSIYVVGTAAATIFAAKIMSIIGRRLGFIFASVAGSISCLIGAYAIIIESFFIFCFAKFILGATMAFTHQYRFAAAESVEKEKAPKAISSLLLAGIVAAFLGIGLANYTKNFVSDYLYVGSYLTLAVLTLIPSFLLFFFKDIREISFISNKENNSRNYSEFFSDPKFLQAITSAAFAYAVMSFLMTATPISMHIVHQLSLEKTGIVLQFHVLAMFLPSLVTGNLIKKFGYSNMMYLGVLFYIFTILLSFFQPSFLNYFISLIFLGIGWNFLFISGTSLLVTTYKPEEKFKAQGFNDLLVFSSMALASLLAGILISIASWKTVNLFCIPFLILIILSIVNADKKR